MTSDRSILEREMGQVELRPFTLEGFHRRRDRRQRNRRVAAALVALVVAAAGAAGLVRAFSSGRVPADEDRSDELGIFAPVAGRILYENSNDRGYDSGYWAIDPNGPSDTTDGPSVAHDVASTLVPLELDGEPLGWSSDGTELLLMRSVGDGLFPEQTLAILHADGSETMLNAQPMGIADATISPDGTRVVFAGQYDLSGLYVIDAQGGRPVRLRVPPTVDVASAPTFSPDGTQFAFLAGNRDTEVWVTNADGTDAHQILADEPTAFRDVTGLEWSPAGDRLAIGLGTHVQSGGSIYTFAPDGSDFTEVIVGGSSPYWSPDGSQIAYTIQCDQDPTFTCVQFDPQAGLDPAGLAIADADGSNVRAFGFAASGPWHPGTPAQPDETTPTPSEGFSRANGEVLSFTGRSLGRAPGDLVAVNPETGEQRVLAQNLDSVFSARWSADGRWVAYETEPPDGDWELWVVGASQEPRLVGTGPQPDLMADYGLDWMWSPTGAQLAITTNSTLSRTIDVTSGETTDLGIVADGQGKPDVDPYWAWSPDGTRIAFQMLRGALHTVDVRSGERSLLVRLPIEDFEWIDAILWSPDGASIAVRTESDSGVGRLFAMNADGSNVRVLADYSDPLLTDWSPDGTRLAFAKRSRPDWRIQIWVAPMDGAAPVEIGSLSFAGCSYNDACELTWSPDGSQIALHKDDGSVTVFDANGAGEAEPIDELTYTSWAGGTYVRQ